MINMLKELQVFKVTAEADRISSIDFFRCIAILAVVVYHFNKWLPFGYLGVDLFFVISGFLVGGLLTKEFERGNPINFFKFFLQRGFKIWPSYFVFIFLGNAIACFFYRQLDPDQIIPAGEYLPYIFFYMNYSANPFHWSFAHVWSLCVEEHFYIMLPILFIGIQKIVPAKNRVKSLFLFVGLTIISGVVFKYLSLRYTHTQDTYFGTLNRVDALAWGVMLNLVLKYFGDRIKMFRYVFLSVILGVIFFAIAIVLELQPGENNPSLILFHQIGFNSLIAMSWVLMIFGLYHTDFSRFRLTRILAYFSYNWYLWHPLFVIFISDHLGKNFQGFLIYFLGTFAIAVLATVFIEEKVLSRRQYILARLFNKKGSL